MPLALTKIVKTPSSRGNFRKSMEPVQATDSRTVDWGETYYARLNVENPLTGIKKKQRVSLLLRRKPAGTRRPTGAPSTTQTGLANRSMPVAPEAFNRIVLLDLRSAPLMTSQFPQ